MYPMEMAHSCGDPVRASTIVVCGCNGCVLSGDDMCQPFYLFFWLTFFPLLPQCFLSLRRGFISICLVQSWAKISLLKWLDQRNEKINELKWMKTAHKTSRRSLGRGRGLLLWELQKENTSIFTSVHEAFSICQAKVHIPTWLWSLKPNQLSSQAALVWN